MCIWRSKTWIYYLLYGLSEEKEKNTSRATCHISRKGVNCQLAHITFHLSPFTCYLSSVTSYLITTICSSTVFECPWRFGDAAADMENVIFFTQKMRKILQKLICDKALSLNFRNIIMNMFDLSWFELFSNRAKW